MRIKAKPLRSALYVPGNKIEWIRKAPKYGADALILDLEDSVPIGEKIAARANVKDMLEELGNVGHTLIVRVNSLGSGLIGSDLEAVISQNLYGIILPKVQSAADVLEVDTLLNLFESRARVSIGRTFVDPGLETALGVRNAYEIAMASPRVVHMGGSGGKGGDTARSIGYHWTAEGNETLFLRSKVLIDSRAAGVEFPLSGGWFEIRDLDGLKKYANGLKNLGYTGMHIIHPSHVPIVNEIFTPTEGDIATWKGLVQAMAQMRKEGGAAVAYNGDMVDIAHEETAKSMLLMAYDLGLIDESELIFDK